MTSGSSSGFQSTPPARGATDDEDDEDDDEEDFNPRPPRGGRLICAARSVTPHKISIHAPREGGDLLSLTSDRKSLSKAMRAHREGGDNNRTYKGNADTYFNPRPPRGGRRG